MSLKKTIKPIIYIIGIGVLLLGVVVIIYLGIKTNHDGYDTMSDNWTMWDYVYGIIGSIATTIAVIVALFKDDILRKFHSPELVIEKYTGGLIPLVKVDGKNGSGDSYYKCELKINNDGAENARNCTIVLSRFLYDTSRMGDGAKSELDPSQIERIIEIGEKNNQIVSGLDTRVELFRINNPSLSSTPNGVMEKANVIFPQVNLGDEIAAESNFEIDYEIRADNAAPIKFKVFIEWTGKWNNSVNEMSNNIKVKIS